MSTTAASAVQAAPRKTVKLPRERKMATSNRDRWPVLLRIPFPIYGHLVAWLSEYLATAFFFFLSLSGEQVAFMSAGYDATLPPALIRLLYSSLSQGFAFAVSSWAFFRITSGLFDPAITYGMCLIGSMTWNRAVWVVFAQFLGALTGAGLARGILPDAFLPRNELVGATKVVRSLFAEFLLSAAFIFLVFLLASDRHKGAALAPIALGLALFTVTLCGGVYSNCSLNPARAFAVSVVAHDFTTYHWIYWLAPLAGGTLAGLLFVWTKQLEIETSDAKHRVAADEEDVENGVAAEPTSQSGHRLDAIPEQQAAEVEAKEEGK